MSEKIERRPTVFIGTSSEGRYLGQNLQLHLDRCADVMVWDQGFFRLSMPFITSLTEDLAKYDFAIFVLTPDDLVESRSKQISSPRDNVVFELGLFMGGVGAPRTLIVHQAGADLKLPSDLDGVNTATYREHDPEQAESALAPTCTRIEKVIRKLGPRENNQRALSIPDEIGLRHFFYGESSNPRRNEAKRRALRDAEGDVVLLAHSGHAYLARHGAHREAVEQLLKRGGARFLVVLLNPFSVSAIEMYLNWLRSFQAHGGDISNRKVVEEFLPQRSKLSSALNAYEDMKSSFGDRIEGRLTSFDSGSTILWTSNACFIEPYHRFDPYQRARQHLSTYELEVEPQGHLGENFGGKRSVTHINFFRRYSMSFATWKRKRKSLLEAAKTNLDLMSGTGEVEQKEASCLSDFLQQLVP